MKERTNQDLLLALDTSTTSMTAAVLQGGRLLGQTTSHAERNHSLYLIPAVQTLLQELGRRQAEVDAFAVGIGPGSYTGVRIGITVAKTMAWALDRPVLGVSSLEALALGAAERVLGVRAPVGQRGASGVSEPAVYVTSRPSAGKGRSDGLDPGMKLDRFANGGPEGNPNQPAGTAACEPGRPRTAWVVPLLDARRGNAYTALFAMETSGAGWTRLRPDANRHAAEWVDELLRLLSGAGVEEADGTNELPAKVASDEAGEATRSMPSLNGGLLPDVVCFVGEPGAFAGPIGHFEEAWRIGRTEMLAHELQGSEVGRLAWDRYMAGEADSRHGLVPNYTQLAEAEVKLLAKRGS